jgi:hypothetical protein
MPAACYLGLLLVLDKRGADMLLPLITIYLPLQGVWSAGYYARLGCRC